MPKIRIHDFETQGLEPHHKVCEVGWTDLLNDGDGWLVGATSSTLCEVDHMPPPARAVHHISAEMTKGFPTFDAAALWVNAKADGVDVVAAHNARYDGQYWGEPKLPVICTFKSARQLWTLEAPSHGNGALRYWLEDQGLISPEAARCEPSHRAGPDTYVTALILQQMLSLTTAAQMVAWTKLPLVEPVCPIGEWRGKIWSEVDAGFLRWMINKPVEADLVWNAKRELDRRHVELEDAERAGGAA